MGEPDPDGTFARAAAQRWNDHHEIHEHETEARRAALDSMNARLTAMNEFRGALQDVQSHAVDRDYYDTQHDALQRRIGDIENELAAHFQLPVHPGAARQLDEYEKRMRAVEQWRDARAATRDELQAQTRADDLRFQPLERFYSRVYIGAIGALVTGGLIVYVIERIINGASK